MIETECQKLVVDAVKEGGGQAIKFNNRFMVGVCDLFIKLPGHQPMLLEAKLIKLSPKTRNHVWDVGCTKLQQDFLRDWHEAGMLTGVVSFILSGDVRTLQMALYTYEHLASLPANTRWRVWQEDHRPLGEKSERLTNIREQLIGFAND